MENETFWGLSPMTLEIAVQDTTNPDWNGRVERLVDAIEEVANINKDGFAPLVTALRIVLQQVDREGQDRFNESRLQRERDARVELTALGL